MTSTSTQLMSFKECCREGSKSSYGPKFKKIGLIETLEATKSTQLFYQLGVKPSSVAAGYWMNHGGETLFRFLS